jgi:putative DNA primase/helicase
VQRAKETITALYQWAASRIKKLSEIKDDPRREEELAKLAKLMAHCLRWEDARAISRSLDLARSEPGVPIVPADLDNDPWLLNVKNGCLDLRTCQLRPHRREDLQTTLAPVAYNPEARCPLWLSFLGVIFEQQTGLIDYVQKLLGYALTGDVRELLLAVCWGRGANGKSTLINAILSMLGEEYAIKANRDLFMAHKQDNHPAQLARLFRKRLVVAVETQEGSRMDEELVKELTGGDPITGRFMRENPWQFLPTHKAFLITNHKPVISGTDNGIWRRIRLIPFNVQIPEDRQDKTLPEKLRAEATGILAWCVRGCQRWQAEGLEPPAEVKAATASYRSEQDVLGEFVRECCIEHRDAKARAANLYAAYRAWSERTGEKMASQTRFGLALKERGFESYTNNGVWYRGLAIREELPD